MTFNSHHRMKKNMATLLDQLKDVIEQESLDDSSLVSVDGATPTLEVHSNRPA